MTDTRARLAQIWCDLLTCGDVTMESDFFDVGGNSVTAVYFAAAVQEACRISIDAVEIVLEREFGKIAALVEQRLAAATAADR